jgi:hypothetical protein
MVASKLILDWSPQQISGWLKTQYPEDEIKTGAVKSLRPSPSAKGPLK